MEFFTLREGTPREENLITDLLCTLINSLKANNPNKKVALVIDDLDRIDPEHIFRIMNVFSAHYDYQGIGGENKFDFDKIILICDIANIRGIFHHRYGSEIDFSGYIDKFYSHEVFNYNFSSTIIENLPSFLYNVKINVDDGHINLKSGDSYYVDELSFLLGYFVQYNALSMRTLVNFLKKKIELPNHAYISGDRNTRFYVKNTPIFIIFELLQSLFGGDVNILKAIDVTIEHAPDIDVRQYEGWTERRMGNVLCMADYSANRLKISNDPYTFVSEELNLKALYKIEPNQSYGFQGNLIKIGSVVETFDAENIEPQNILTKFRVNYFKIFRTAYKIYRQLPKVH